MTSQKQIYLLKQEKIILLDRIYAAMEKINSLKSFYLDTSGQEYPDTQEGAIDFHLDAYENIPSIHMIYNEIDGIIKRIIEVDTEIEVEKYKLGC